MTVTLLNLLSFPKFYILAKTFQPLNNTPNFSSVSVDCDLKKNVAYLLYPIDLNFNYSRR